MIKIEFEKKDDVKFLLEMINILNFPGKEINRVYRIKKNIENAYQEVQEAQDELKE